MSAIELFQEQKDCCGCGACMNVCPKGAITMRADEFGFLYPNIDPARCVECAACKNVCGYQSRPDYHSVKKAYAVAARDAELLRHSASGGISTVVADRVLRDGGVIYGSALLYEESKLEPKHIRVDTPEGLRQLQGSKYVQSDIGFTYQQARQDLVAGRQVLFSGTPCQIAGLKQFLRHDYENLLTMEIICHGVPNKQLFHDFIDYYGKRLGGTIKEFYFRDKSKGQGMMTRSVYVDGTGKVHEKVKAGNLLAYVFFFSTCQVYRESCYSCCFATKKRIADLTVGDFWGFHEEYPNYREKDGLSNSKGISCVLANTEKGIDAIGKSKSRLVLMETEFQKIAKHNKQLNSPSKCGSLRKTILTLYVDHGYDLVDRYYKKRFWFKRATARLSGILPKSIKRQAKKLMGHLKSE